MSDRIVTINDLIPLADIAEASIGNKQLQRINDGQIRIATARSICNQEGYFANNTDNILDLFLRVTYDDGLRETALWPISTLIEEIRDGVAFIMHED